MGVKFLLRERFRLTCDCKRIFGPLLEIGVIILLIKFFSEVVVGRIARELVGDVLVVIAFRRTGVKLEIEVCSDC